MARKAERIPFLDDALEIFNGVVFDEPIAVSDAKLDDEKDDSDEPRKPRVGNTLKPARSAKSEEGTKDARRKGGDDGADARGVSSGRKSASGGNADDKPDNTPDKKDDSKGDNSDSDS